LCQICSTDEKGDGPFFGVFSAGIHELNLSTQDPGDLKMVNFKTIGYGGRDNNSQISALKEMNAEAVIDVRHKPHCCWNRDFCGGVLKDKLAAEGIDYLWISDLGNMNMTRDINKNKITLVNEVRGIEKVLSVATQYEYDTVVLLCAEADEKKCHRSYIRDKLAAAVNPPSFHPV
jgi:uncharacterized protein (DUF488 family)